MLNQILDENINGEMSVEGTRDNSEESLILTESLENNTTESNGLENFGLEEETPNLFEESASVDDSSLSDKENNLDEEEYEIPAFLRRQKN